MTSLKKQTVSGVKWVLIASIAQRIISLGGTVILARMLSPADFGLFSLAFVMIDGLGIFKSLGFDSALVRRKDDIDKAANTAFFLIPSMGIILFVILMIIAPISARFLNNVSVTNVIRALAVIFVFSCFGKVPQTLLYRDMKFKYKSIAEVTSQLAYVLIAVAMAFNKFGVWSLVVAYIFKTLIQVSIEWYFSGWKPKLEFDKKIAWEMFHFGKYVLAGAIIWFLCGNLDNIITGKILGVTMLGYYAFSKNLSNILTDYLLSRFGMIMYPAYSKIKDDAEEIKRIMLRMMRYVSIIVFPFSFGLFVFAPDILRFVLGEKWLPASPVLRILSFISIFHTLWITIWPVFLARGKSRMDFQVGLIQVCVFFALVIPLGFKFKLVGVGIALLLSIMTSSIVALLSLKSVIDIEISSIIDAVNPALSCSLLMLVVVMLLKSFIPTGNISYNFFISAGMSGLVYLLAMHFMNRDIFKSVKEVLF